VGAAGFRQVLPLPRSSPTDPHPSLFALAFAAAEYRHKISGAEGPFFDPAGIAPKDPAEFKKMQLKELKNGRAAMIAIAAAAAAHYVPGSVPGFPFPQ